MFPSGPFLGREFNHESWYLNSVVRELLEAAFGAGGDLRPRVFALMCLRPLRHCRYRYGTTLVEGLFHGKWRSHVIV